MSACPEAPPLQKTDIPMILSSPREAAARTPIRVEVDWEQVAAHLTRALELNPRMPEAIRYWPYVQEKLKQKLSDGK